MKIKKKGCTLILQKEDSIAGKQAIKASNSFAGDYRTAACEGSGCTPCEETMSQEAVPIMIKASLGLNHSRRRRQVPKGEANGGPSIAEIPLLSSSPNG
jgi:hypothetical protein